MRCQKDEMAAGRAYPRTCEACGLTGPCIKGYDPKWTISNPVGHGPAIFPDDDRNQEVVDRMASFIGSIQNEFL